MKKKAISKLLKTFKDIEKNIMKHETPTTFEAVGAHFKLKDLTNEAFKELGLNMTDAYNIVKYATCGEETSVGPYIISHYIDMFKQLKNLSEVITEGDIWSRQYVIQFPAIHCFQSIQFLFRDNEVFVVVNMRSCNFRKNFLMDVFLSYYCGVTLAQAIEEKYECTMDRIHVIMNIGSLHIFKNEV